MPHRGSEEAFTFRDLPILRVELCTFKHYDTLLAEDTQSDVVLLVSMVDTGAGPKVVKTNGVVVRMVLVCVVMSGYVFV